MTFDLTETEKKTSKTTSASTKPAISVFIQLIRRLNHEFLSLHHHLCFVTQYLHLLRQLVTAPQTRNLTKMNFGRSVLGLGSPLIDIHAEVTTKFLSKHSLASNSATVAEGKNDLFGELDNFDLTYQPGGCITNTMRVLKWLLDDDETRPVVYLGAVGRDKHADIIARCLSEEKVTFRFEVIEEKPTGKCAVLLNGQNRSLCTDLGASNCYQIEHLSKPEVLRLIDEAGYVYMSAFFLGVSYDCMKFLAMKCSVDDKCFVLNLAAPFVCYKYSRELENLVGYVDVIIGNEYEARAFAIANEIVEHELPAIVTNINNLKKHNSNKKRITIITRGAQPILIAHDDKIEEFQVDSLPGELVKDTNAAGDAFAGGFLAQFVQNRPLEKCVECGVWAATQIVQNIGCDFNGGLKYRGG